MEDEKLNKNGLIKVWLKIWTLLKLLVGDVDVTGKGDLQTQINNIDNRVDKCFRNASDGKKLIADAVTGKGVPTLVSDTFATMAANIAKIRSSARLQGKTAVLSNVAQTIKPDADYDGLSQVSVPAVRGTAGTGDVLTGKTFSGAAGIEKAGTMPENGAWTGETTGNGNVPIPAGHHNGQGYVSGAGAYAKGMVDADARTNTNSANYKNGYNAGVTATKKGTAGTGDVLTGKTFTNASSVEAAGAMANKGAVTVDAGGVTQDDTYTYLAVPAAAFYNANSKLRTKNSNIFAKSKIAVKSLAAFIPSGSGSATTQAVFTLPKACQLLEIEYSVTGGYYYSNELFIDNVSYGEGYPSKTISKTNVPAGTEIRLVAKRNNPDNLQSSVSANASIAYVHRI